MESRQVGKKWRFFYHYYRYGEKKMSVHFRGKCRWVDDVKCEVPCETKWNKRQPHLVMRGMASAVKVKGGVAYIQ